jgi:hypothetical protein
MKAQTATAKVSYRSVDILLMWWRWTGTGHGVSSCIQWEQSEYGVAMGNSVAKCRVV